MPAYVDSSLVLAILQDEAKTAEAIALWDSHPDRMCSRLLSAECLTVLRRAARVKKLGGSWYRRAQARLERFLEEVSRQDVTQDIVAQLFREEGLGQCRTLDAVHLATALFFRSRCDDPDDFVLLTFDDSMAEAARAVGLRVQPGSSPATR